MGVHDGGRQSSRNPEASLQLIEQGKEVQQIIAGFIRYCRDWLLYHSDPVFVSEDAVFLRR